MKLVALPFRLPDVAFDAALADESLWSRSCVSHPATAAPLSLDGLDFLIIYVILARLFINLQIYDVERVMGHVRRWRTASGDQGRWMVPGSRRRHQKRRWLLVLDHDVPVR